MNRFCNETGVAIFPVSTSSHPPFPITAFIFTIVQWGPLSEGQLARPIQAEGTTTRSSGSHGPRPESVTIINRVEELAKKKGWTMSQVTLAWTLKRVTSPIIGFSSAERIDEALSARGKELTEEEEKYLEEAYTPQEIQGHF